MVTYFAQFEPDLKHGGYSVSFPDLPHGATQGESLAEAHEMAQDLLIEILSELIRRGSELPIARRHRGRNVRAVSLPVLPSAKVELYEAFRVSGLRKAEFARRIGIPKANLDRLFDLTHESRFDQIERAFEVLGKTVELTVRNAA